MTNRIARQANLDELTQELLANLQKPVMVFNFACADTRTNSGADTRAKNAAESIQTILDDYVIDRYVVLTVQGQVQE
jgi:hypothetical protein